MKLRHLKQVIKEEIQRLSEQGAGPRPLGPPGMGTTGMKPQTQMAGGTCPEARNPGQSLFRAMGSPRNWGQFKSAYNSFYQKAVRNPQGITLTSPAQLAQRIDQGKVGPTPTPQGIPPLIIGIGIGAVGGGAVTGFVCWFFGGAFDE